MADTIFPNVDEFTLEPNGKPTFIDPKNRRWTTFRGATLWNYPNEGDELLPDHKLWLETDIVRTLRNGRARGLGCRLVGSASNDKAGVKHNMQVADRRAKKAKAFLLGRGVDAKQIFEVTATMNTTAPSKDAHERNVNVHLEKPVNTMFAIRKVVLAAGTSLLPWGAVHFFQIRDRTHNLDAFYVLARNRPPNVSFPGPRFALAPGTGLFDSFVTLPAVVAVEDFDGANMTVTAINESPNVLGETPWAMLEQPGLFLSTFFIPEFRMESSRIGGKLFLVRGPEVPQLL